MRKIIFGLLAVFGILAILFFLTTTMTTPRTIGLTLPGNEKPKDPSNYKDIIELVLAGNEKIFAYRGDMSSAKLLSLSPENTVRSYLKAMKGSFTDSVFILIRTSEKTEMRTTVDVLDEMTINGIKNFAVDAMTPEQEKKFLQAINGSKSTNEDMALKE
jgi:biopolymer transport protein ExbD